jgi:hypothetical protein
MGFHKQYPNRKDWRKPSTRVFRDCRPHGGCPWCEASRRHQLNKQLLRVTDYDEQTHHKRQRKIPR